MDWGVKGQYLLIVVSDRSALDRGLVIQFTAMTFPGVSHTIGSTHTVGSISRTQQSVVIAPAIPFFVLQRSSVVAM